MDARYVLDVARKVGKRKLPKAELWQPAKSHFRSHVEGFDAAVDKLRAWGYLRKVPGERPEGKAKQGKAPGPVYLVNPSLFPHEV